MCCVVTIFTLYRLLNRTSRSSALPDPEHGCRRMPAPARSLCITVPSYAAADHSMKVLGWIKPPAPRQVVLAPDKLRAECAFSAVPVPGIEMTVQKNTTAFSYAAADHSM